jgi:hypothetical protein
VRLCQPVERIEPPTFEYESGRLILIKRMWSANYVKTVSEISEDVQSLNSLSK